MSKGSSPRPFEVDHETYSNNFDAIFGNKCPECDSKPCKCNEMKEDENERPI